MRTAGPSPEISTETRSEREGSIEDAVTGLPLEAENRTSDVAR
jgi:hypothetical protein